MAKARFAKGLRTGSTKTETYSTLATLKQGRVQIIKDRVTDVANPQTSAQMQQRVIFATVTQAAQHMVSLIGLSREGVTNKEFARQLFVSDNIAFLKSVAGRRVGLNLHYLAAYAPKGNKQLIPNSYIVSRGSLTTPAVLVPRSSGNSGSFGAFNFSAIGELGAVPFGSYTPAQLWEFIFGLKPGDQITVPQIYGDETAQALYNGDSETSPIIDKTLVTQFAAPRLVLLSEMPATTLTVNADITLEAIKAALLSGIDQDSSYTSLVNNLLSGISIDDTADDVLQLTNIDTYDLALGVLGGTCRAMGVILSRINPDTGKWQYSTTQLTCVWDFIGVNSGQNYFGFTLDNAVTTYLETVSTTANGNFLQRGGSDDLVPATFQ